jgi:hypothetical protein|tara:strand:+ start:121 stop:591 length:471 start_codon:yes stop_codon:yes gene_type:complete
MDDFGDAYYPFDDESDRKSLPKGRYTATIINLEISKDVRFGSYIADVFKPEYLIDVTEHPAYEDVIVKDDGIFRYKEVEGMKYEHKKNWGFAKFISMMKIGKRGNQLPFLSLSSIRKSRVLIDVFIKKFYNDLDSEVNYPVARAIQLLEKRLDTPF